MVGEQLLCSSDRLIVGLNFNLKSSLFACMHYETENFQSNFKILLVPGISVLKVRKVPIIARIDTENLLRGGAKKIKFL